MDWNSYIEKFNNLVRKQDSFRSDMNTLWLEDVFLSWRWWFELGLTVFPWVIWLIFRKRDSTDRLLYAGMFVMLFSMVSDVIGMVAGLWTYPVNLVPMMTAFFPFDLSAMPVATMLSLQFFPKLKPVYKAVVYAAAGAFIFQPVIHSLGLYRHIIWKDYYTFPVLILVYLMAHHVATRHRFKALV